jgi:hypothetical protein
MSDDDIEVTPSRGANVFARFVPPVDPLGEDGHARPSRMTQREQMVAVGLGLANVAIAAGTASAMENQRGLALLAGLLASVITIVGARVGNRIMTMVGLFASVVTRSSSTVVFLTFGMPYYAAALWMFMKYNRLVKAQTLLRRQQRSESKGPGGGAATSTRGRVESGTAAPKGRPTKSKRYTPPKPPKKRPPPPSKPPRDRSIVD